VAQMKAHALPLVPLEQLLGDAAEKVLAAALPLDSFEYAFR
jgi:hypothetical protein